MTPGSVPAGYLGVLASLPVYVFRLTPLFLYPLLLRFVFLHYPLFIYAVISPFLTFTISYSSLSSPFHLSAHSLLQHSVHQREAKSLLHVGEYK